VATTPEELEVSLVRNGLEATSFEGGTVSLLRRLDHPVALALSTASAESLRGAAGEGAARGSTSSPQHWVALVGFEGDRVRVAGLIQGREVSVPIDEIEAHWSEVGIIVWERYEQIPEILMYNDEGGSVIWLQQALAELDFLSEPSSGLFDRATVDALKRFQGDRGLVADGIAGPLTQLALFSQLERYPVPRLSAAKASAASAVSNANEPGLPNAPSPPPPAGGERG
jgi:hypothetical protein